MKFLFIAPRFHTNQHVWVKTLISHGHEVEFWVREKTFWEDYEALVPRIAKNFFWSWREMRKFRPDIVVARDPHSYFFIFTKIIVARIQGRSIVFYTQTPLYKKMAPAKKALVCVILALFKARWITPIEGSKKDFKKFHKKAYYVPFAVEPRSTNRVSDKGPVRIISVGKFYQERKNHLLLLEASKGLMEEGKKIFLTIIGATSGKNPGYFKSVENYIKGNDMQDRVQIKADLNHREMSSEYEKHNLFVMASINEPLAYSPLEAMSVGLPVVCSDTNGFRFYIIEAQNGYVFKSGDIEDLKEKIKKAIFYAEEMGKRSLEIVERFYAPEAFYKKFMEAIESFYNL